MEKQFIDWLKQRFPAGGNVSLGIGDDAAVIKLPEGDIVFATDAICDGVHFDSDQCAPEQIGRKSLAINLSDLAAMGATPLAAVVSVTLPQTTSFDYAKRLYEGMQPLASEFKIRVCGGDTVVWSGKLVITVTVLGAAPESGVWRIDNARPGDSIVVTGRFGGSLRGRHLAFEPRCHLTERWSNQGIVRAATDASDSLSLDLQKMAVASNVGFEIHADRIPVSDDARALATKETQVGGDVDRTALDHALFDGEDFELILAVDPTDVPKMLVEDDCDTLLTDIGRFTKENRFQIVIEDQRHDFEPRGFQHRLVDNCDTDLH